MILAVIGYIVFVLVLYRLESGQLDREALRQGRLTILRQPRQQVKESRWVVVDLRTLSGFRDVPWRVEDDDGGW